MGGRSFFCDRSACSVGFFAAVSEIKSSVQSRLQSILWSCIAAGSCERCPAFLACVLLDAGLECFFEIALSVGSVAELSEFMNLG